MQSLRRWGGTAGIVAGIALLWVLIALVLVLPAAGLAPDDQSNPDKLLPFVAANSLLNFLVNVVGGSLAVVFGWVLFYGLGERFRAEAPMRSRVAPVFTTLGVTMFGITSLMRYVGLSNLAALSATDKVAATHAFFALNAGSLGIEAFGNLAVGLGLLLFGSVMTGVGRYRGAGYVAWITGLVTLASIVSASPVFFLGGTVLTIIWLLWTGVTLRSESAGG